MSKDIFLQEGKERRRYLSQDEVYKLPSQDNSILHPIFSHIRASMMMLENEFHDFQHHKLTVGKARS